MGNAIPNGYTGKPLNQQIVGAYGSALGGAQAAQGAAMDPNTNQLSTANLQPYMNPYTKDVTNATIGELDRQEALQGRQIAATAQDQGAFGGDRFAIQQAANNRDYDVTRAQAMAGLNQSNYNNAQQGAQFDINNRLQAGQLGQSQLGSLANMGFGWGNTMNQNNLAAGAMQTQQQQALIDAIKGQFSGYTGQGSESLQQILAALTGSKPDPKTSEKGATQGWLGTAISGIGLLPGL